MEASLLSLQNNSSINALINFSVHFTLQSYVVFGKRKIIIIRLFIISSLVFCHNFQVEFYLLNKY